MSDSKRTDNDGVAVKTKDRPKIISSKSTGEITIKHRKIEKKDKGDVVNKDGSMTDRTEKDKKEKKEKKKGDPSKKDKKKRDSFRLSKSLVDPNSENKTATSDEHKQGPHTLGSPHPLSASMSSPSIKVMESSSASRSGGHSRHSSKDESSNTNSTSRKSKTPRSPRVDALKESDADTDEQTDEDKQTIATLKFKRDQFIRTISSRHVQLPMHVKAVFSETIEESDDESSSSGMDWEDPNFELQIDQQIKELGEPLPEETALLSNLQSMLKIPSWKNDDWIQTLQEEKDRVEKDKRKSLNAEQIETTTSGRRTSLGPMSSPGSRSTIEASGGRSHRASSGSKPVMKAKVGYVLLKSKLGPWKRRYLILDDTRLTAKKSPVEIKAKLVIPMLFSQCKVIDKPLSGKRKLYMFEIFTPDTKFLMATDSQQSTQDWVTSIQKACDNQMLQSLDLQESANGHDKEDLKPEVKELLEIMKLPGNNICTDCDAVDPEWAVINIGNFVCIDCSGVHRALGVQVSKVRSIYLDNWEPEAVAYMRTMGNKKVNEIWESKVPSYREKPKQNATREKRMFWIVSKYVKKEFFDWNRASEAKVDPENHQSISSTVLAAKMIPTDMAELKKAILNLVKEDESFRKQMKELIFGDTEMRQAMDSESSNNTASKDKGRTRATTTTGL